MFPINDWTGVCGLQIHWLKLSRWHQIWQISFNDSVARRKTIIETGCGERQRYRRNIILLSRHGKMDLRRVFPFGKTHSHCICSLLFKPRLKLNPPPGIVARHGRRCATRIWVWDLELYEHYSGRPRVPRSNTECMAKYILRVTNMSAILGNTFMSSHPGTSWYSHRPVLGREQSGMKVLILLQKKSGQHL